MATVVQLTSLTFEKRGEMAQPTHKQRQSRVEVKEEKLTFHLIHISWLSAISLAEEQNGNSL